MKYVLVIGDGMADNPVEFLGGRTPLEVADKPYFDMLCAKGRIGSVLTVPEGVPAGSDTAILSIFGCDPRKYYTGRSPLEAAGCGVELAAGDVSYRCNMTALEGEGEFEDLIIRSHSGGSIDGPSSIALAEYLSGHPDFAPLLAKYRMKIYPNGSFRHIAVQKGLESGKINATPPHDILGSRIGDYLPRDGEAADGLREMMEVSWRLLKDHPINLKRMENGLLPANCIWFWAEGTAVMLDSFYSRYGKTGTVVSAVPLVAGIANLGGLKYAEVEGATGELDTNFEGKVGAVLSALKAGDDFAAVHYEAPDECTHGGDTDGKLEAIHRLSELIIKPIAEELDRRGEDWRMLVLSDHKTLTSTRTHDGDPVPFLIYDSRTDTGCGLGYTEKAGLTGEYIHEGATLPEILFADN